MQFPFLPSLFSNRPEKKTFWLVKLAFQSPLKETLMVHDTLSLSFIEEILGVRV
jgi:hypothetical protein